MRRLKFKVSEEESYKPRFLLSSLFSLQSSPLHRLALCAFMALAPPSAAFGQDAPHYDFAPLPTTTIDPDLGYEAKLDLSDRGAASDPNAEVAALVVECDSIGEPNSPFTRSFAYRGNLLLITKNGVILREIKMRLSFTGTADLYVSVHRFEDGTYKRFMDDIIIIQAEGTGSLKFYPTGPINNGDGVLLPPGFEYAIAFAWGSTAITFAHDGLSGTRPIEAAGSVRGSLAIDHLGTFDPPQPPVSDNFPALSVFGGVYEMELCFVPQPGACCSGGSCADKLATQCSGDGSFFHGQGTTCAETPCEFGACCDKCGRCQDDFTPQACTAAGGLAQWPGADCPAIPAALCQRITGACCTGTTCDDTKCEAECIAGGGVYRGGGTDCTPNICQGACCISSFGQCLELEQTTCAQLNGSYKDDGTLCNTLPPESECGGACCFGTPTGGLTSCQPVSKRSSCSFVSSSVIRAYKGDLTSCGACGSFDSYHKCCLPDGVCIDTTLDACNAALGDYDGAVHCSGSCTKNACCFTDGTCRLMTVNGCAGLGGASQPGVSCPVNLCASYIPTGACCGTAAGACTVATRAQCESQGKVYRGDNTNCTNPSAVCPGSGACCRTNGDCFDDFSAAQCAAVDGVYQENSSACFVQPVDCDNRGVCCAITGLCLFEDPGTCAEIGGAFRGEGGSCVGADVCISGACCIDHTCVPRTQAACAVEGGVYKGNNTTCAADTCAGACCELSGQCTEGAPGSACAGAGQVFHLDTLCADVQPPCAVSQIGACCNGNTGDCADGVAEANCQGANTRFGGGGSTCATLNPPCTAPGGACCTESTGECAENVLQANCQAVGQRWGGAGVACTALDPPCAPPPTTGACCNGTNCSVVTQAQCASGSYKGDNVPCEANTCAPSCTTIVGDTTPQNCSIDARQPFPPGNSNSPEGWDAITFTFDCSDTSNLTKNDFSVSTTPPGTAPAITGVTFDGASITVNLSGPIPPGAWTCVEFVPSGAKRCLGFLPADANSDRTAAPVDILDIIDNLNNVRQPPLLPHQCDLDRSERCAPDDILTEIDLLNGASGFLDWNGKTLPVCPSAP